MARTEEQQQAPQDEAKPKKEAQPTEYIVLGKTADGTWRELGKQTVIGDKKAIEPFALKNEELKVQLDKEGEAQGEIMAAFVAVPARSFRPRQPKPKEITPRLSW